MITYTDDEEALFALIKGPVWPDQCEHEDGSYVASFEVVDSVPVPDDSPESFTLRLSKYDLYVFPQRYYGQEVCIRYGSKCGEYISPGSLGEFLAKNNHEPYTSAIRILLHFGRALWVPKENKEGNA